MTSVRSEESRRDKVAVVLGVNGQDGSYLAERLMVCGYPVIGVGKQLNSKWVNKNQAFTYLPLDVTNLGAFHRFLQEAQPDLIFHFAAIHGPAGFGYEERWADVHCVNTLVTNAILEYMRTQKPSAAFVYPSSSKVFLLHPSVRISETSERRSSCIYTISKNAATDLIEYYRVNYGVKGTVVWSFNHESPRRLKAFFVPRIVEILAQSILDRHYRGTIENLQFWCDWGDAQEYMEIVVDIARASVGEDFVLASGSTRWAEEFVNELFSQYGLNASEHVKELNRSNMAKEAPWSADISRLKRIVGRAPARTVFEVCEDILRVNFPNSWSAADRTKWVEKSSQGASGFR